MTYSFAVPDSTFLDDVADTLAKLPGVEAVALGGSRAQGTQHPDSDWDLAVYYRGGFDPQTIRDLGWSGAISDLGGWGPTFNGGGKLTVEGQAIDVHYRDLAFIERIHDDAVRGEFTIEPLLFHQAGLPSYLLLAELGMNVALRGEMPVWGYPDALRRSAPPVWWNRAQLTLTYAEEGHAKHGRVAQCAALLAEAACYAAHALLAHRGEWVTNEKQLLSKAGLRGIDDIVAGLAADSASLLRGARQACALLEDAIEAAGI